MGDRDLGCERCGVLDETLRVALFSTTMSFLVMTRRTASGGILCGSCRRSEALRAGGVSAVLGWWGIPWGPIYTVGSIATALGGGSKPPEANAALLHAVGLALLDVDDREGAVRALETSLTYGDDAETRGALMFARGAAEEADVPAHRASTLHPGDLVDTRHGHVVVREAPDDASEGAPLPAGASAVVISGRDGWTCLSLPGGRTGWVRSDDLVAAA